MCDETCCVQLAASWTLRADLSSAYVCRLLNHMDRHGYKQCVPRHDNADMEVRPLLGLTSGYVKRGANQFPKQGSKPPWRLRMNYALDVPALRFGRIEDGTMRFSRSAPGVGARQPVTTSTI